MPELARRSKRERPPKTRRYRLAELPTAALARLSEAIAVAEETPTQARRRGSSKPLLVLGKGRFVLYQPWEAKLTTPEGALVEELRVGPAVIGEVSPRPEGCVVEVRARPYAPTPRQLLRMGVTVGGTGLLFAALLLASGPHPFLLVVALMVTVGTGVGLLSYQRDQRRQDLRDLFALVERTFAPRELPDADPAPHRVRREL